MLAQPAASAKRVSIFLSRSLATASASEVFPVVTVTASAVSPCGNLNIRIVPRSSGSNRVRAQQVVDAADRQSPVTDGKSHPLGSAAAAIATSKYSRQARLECLR